MGVCSCKPYLSAIIIQSVYAGMFLLYKAALDRGLSSRVFVFYTQAVSFIFQIILTIIYNGILRKEISDGMPSCRQLLKIFIVALCGITLCLNLYGIALADTSAVLAAATMPVISFPILGQATIAAAPSFLKGLLCCECARSIIGAVLAFLKRFLCFLRPRREASTLTKDKVVGILVCIAGIAILAFYKGPILNDSHSDKADSHSTWKWILGFFLMLIADIMWGFWLVLQGLVLICFPHQLLFTTLQCLFGTVQSFAIAKAMEGNNHDQWKLGSDAVKYSAVAYCGIVVPGITFYLQPWCIAQHYSIFLAKWSPFSLLITILFSAFLLHESIRLGSVLGGILLLGGLYIIIWARRS